MSYEPWFLKDNYKSVKKNGLTVFSCFHCGGGSTMGYKLAGFDVLGGVEIDPKLAKMYKKNHNPRHQYVMSVSDFKNIPDTDLPAELFNLDVLDGSPPCSSFSMSGSRDNAWGVSKKFREGQANQILDTLFFDFIDIAKKLRPKVVVAENVMGILSGKAKKYIIKIKSSFEDAGYKLKVFSLDSIHLGVPQSRKRVFFIATREECNINLADFEKHKPITFGEIRDHTSSKRKQLSLGVKAVYDLGVLGTDSSLSAAYERKYGKGKYFNTAIIHDNRVHPTLIASGGSILFDGSGELKDSEVIKISTFPEDYDFCGQGVSYVCGMSVPPYFMRYVAGRVRDYLLG
jgi:DNA (cytosine-5)-methyltransferase 1